MRARAKSPINAHPGILSFRMAIGALLGRTVGRQIPYEYIAAAGRLSIDPGLRSQHLS
jgi:hypothetical protein